MLEKILSTPGFFYCRTFDLTRSFQAQSKDSTSGSLFKKCNKEHAWNGFLLQQLLKAYPSDSITVEDFCCPIIHGFVEIIPNLTVAGKSDSSYALISRRSVHRPGTRFFSRGLDSSANASNFVETEQILLTSGNTFSFLQLRGSIPLMWTQNPTLKYTPVIHVPGVVRTSDQSDPRPEFTVDASQKSICERHFKEAFESRGYGKNICINLINQTGRERILERSFAQAVQPIASTMVKYESFDFHRECGLNKWHRLKTLMDRLEPEMTQMQYFHLLVPSNGTFSEALSLSNKSVRKNQQGIFRTNCVDCLDRTNVVQSMLGKLALHSWLSEVGILAEATMDHNGNISLDKIWPSFEFKFRNLWADHADMISIQYSGTPALKTDFTRLGKRTLMGKLNDGWHSLQRYYLNNFCDGMRQDSMNLLLGHHSPCNLDGSYRPIPAAASLSLWKKLLPPVFLVTFSLLVFTVMFSNDPMTQKMNRIMAYGTGSALTLFTIFTFGEEYVLKPRLHSFRGY
ncbi:Phosphatidylinositide phosphatase SAC1 [Cichlidogyrus casuarinus]|uniref:Phosphatidylinositol-3-phosphatase SAC1 n=1 Tax=Cichlidogyrus casuarinus TaxID=1844966 RepID=A0ABD2QBW2_9PLAT